VDQPDRLGVALNYDGYSFLAVEVHESIAFVTLNRPGQLNACNHADHEEYLQILKDLAADGDVRVALFTGAGRAFSAGAHHDYLEELVSGPEWLGPLHDQARGLVHGLIDFEKPLVTAVNGFAAGSGLVLALFSDIVIADRSATLADGHVRVAMAAGDGGVLIWPLAAGITKAKRYLLLGDGISAVEAERAGLVTEVVDDGESLTRATEFARRFVALPEQAVRYTKRALNQWLRLGASVAGDYSLGLQIETVATSRELIRERAVAMRNKTCDSGDGRRR
jgi:enoyl-CoA hydratase